MLGPPGASRSLGLVALERRRRELAEVVLVEVVVVLVLPCEHVQELGVLVVLQCERVQELGVLVVVDVVVLVEIIGLVAVEGVDPDDAIEVGESLGGVGLVGLVDVDGLGEPLPRLVLPAGGQQCIGEGELQPRGPRLGARRRQLRALQRDDGSVELTEVAAGARGDDAHLHPTGPVEPVDLVRTRHGDGALRTTETPLAVGHDRPVAVRARYPPSRTELREGVGVLTCGVRRDACSLPDDGQPAAAGDGRLRVLPGQVGTVLEQPRRHDEVARDDLRGLRRERAQVATDRLVELLPCHVGRDRGTHRTGRTRPTVVAGAATVVARGTPAVVEAARAAPVRAIPVGTLGTVTLRAIAVGTRRAVVVGTRGTVTGGTPLTTLRAVAVGTLRAVAIRARRAVLVGTRTPVTGGTPRPPCGRSP